jgi:hypothetical protein
MFGQTFQHVIEKPQASGYLTLPLAIQIQGQGDGRLTGFDGLRWRDGSWGNLCYSVHQGGQILFI